MTQKTILIIDDEVSICKSLEGILSDEGFFVVSSSHSVNTLHLIEAHNPELILLDIWMQGMDGIEILKQIKKNRPDIFVVMMSGHASIATAVEATKLGASDFIEKPLDLKAVLASINRVLSVKASLKTSEVKSESSQTLSLPSQHVTTDIQIKRSTKSRGPKNSTINEFILGEEHASHDENGILEEGISVEKIKFRPVVFQSIGLKGKKIPQRTLASGTILYGQGLHSGKKSGLIFEPLPPNTGIHFVSVTEEEAVPAYIDYIQSTGFATTIRLGATQAGTIEHLMSALHGYGISNLLIKCNGEVPVMDGSAFPFCQLFDEVGVVEQEGDWYEIAIPETIRVISTQKSDHEEFIQIEPYDSFVIEYTLNYPEPVGRQVYTFKLSSKQEYVELISKARTFGFVKDIEYLQKQGLALGGRFDNFVLMGESGPINCDFRYPDELVRHKILDLIGDLYLLGRPIAGKITAQMTGHSDNIALLEKVKALMEKK
jgi:UDP-3-O-[3-hydroxymyristoyl] N-acetylglucosamine deacetylase